MILIIKAFLSHGIYLHACMYKKKMKKNFISASYFIYLYRCKAALDRFHGQLRSENFVPPRLTVSKLGHFYNKVLFAALEDNEGLEDLKSK